MKLMLILGLSIAMFETKTVKAKIVDKKSGYFHTSKENRNSANVFRDAFKVKSKIDCALKCLQNKDCTNHNYEKDLKLCELSNSLDVEDELQLPEKHGNVTSWSIGYFRIHEEFCHEIVRMIE